MSTSSMLSKSQLGRLVERAHEVAPAELGFEPSGPAGEIAVAGARQARAHVRLLHAVVDVDRETDALAAEPALAGGDDRRVEIAGVDQERRERRTDELRA